MMVQDGGRVLEQARERLAAADDALRRLHGAKRIALAGGDEEWLTDVRAALPAALAAKREASDRLAEAIEAHVIARDGALPPAAERGRELRYELRAHAGTVYDASEGTS